MLKGSCGDGEELTEDAVGSEARLESPEYVNRQCVGVREKPRHGRVRERPHHEGDAALLVPVWVDAHGRDLLLADQPGEKEANVEALLSQCLGTRFHVRTAQRSELSVR